MVTGTTTGNLRELFVKCPRQTSMYNHYGPWRGHDSTPCKGLYGVLAEDPKKFTAKPLRVTLCNVTCRGRGGPGLRL